MMYCRISTPSVEHGYIKFPKQPRDAHKFYIVYFKLTFAVKKQTQLARSVIECYTTTRHYNEINLLEENHITFFHFTLHCNIK